MRYPPHLLDEIKTRLPLSEVVGRRVRLKKAGREWKGLSPFNAEKSPSFFVNDQKQFYKCFSSGKHGDAFTFLMETEGLTFPEAVERLAAEAGVVLPKPSEESRVAEVRHRSALEVMELAACFFEAELAGRAGAAARDYLTGRGLGPETRARFRIGYAPAGRHALRDHLAGKDVTVETMVELGLLVGGDDIPVAYDRFRDRVIFPICDVRGRVIAFGGRALSKEVSAKYLNSPETPLFHKGDVLYNHHNARKAAHDRGTVVAVEGYVDAVAMTMAGHANVVAPLGTALTENQLGLLWRMAEEPILCFDGDKAGRRAAYRALDVAIPVLTAGKSLRFALLPEGQDPDDLARSGGPKAIDRVLASALPLVDLLWARETEAGPADTPERRAALAKRLRDAVASIRDETLKRFYRDEIETRLRAASPRQSWQPGGKGRGGRGRVGEPVSPRLQAGSAGPLLMGTAQFAGGMSDREALIVLALMNHPELLGLEAEDLAGLDFEHPGARAIRDVLLHAMAEGAELDPAVLRARADRAGLGEIVETLSTAATRNHRWALGPYADPVKLAGTLRQAVILHRKSRTLNSELRAAERALAEEESDANLAWLCDVVGRMQSLDGAEAHADETGDELPLEALPSLGARG